MACVVYSLLHSFEFQVSDYVKSLLTIVFSGLYGLSVTVSCVAPMATEVRDLSCSLAYKRNGCSSTVRRLGLMVRKLQRVREQPRGGFMLIPYDNSSGDRLMPQICIGTESKFEL